MLYKEIAGDSIGKGKKYHQKLRQTAIDRKQTILNNRAKKIARLKKKGNTKRLKKLNAKYASQDANPNSTINRLSTTITELNELESSDQIFNFITNSSDVNTETGAIANVMYDSSSGEININVGGSYNASYFAHEAKHAYQFLEGKISFGSSGHGGVLYDLQDEVEAYRRQSLFGQGKSLSEIKRDPNYKGIKNRTTQLTLDSKVIPNVPNSATYRMQFPRLKGTANEQFYIKN